MCTTADMAWFTLAVFYATTVNALDLLYPYGVHHGDNERTNRSTHGDTLHLNNSIIMFSNEYKSIHINQNGVISPAKLISLGDDRLLNYSSTVIAVYSLPYINGKVFYRETFNTSVLEMATQDVRLKESNSDFTANQAVIVSYIDMAYMMDLKQVYTFQAVLASNSNETYLILNYLKLGVTQAANGVSIESCNAWVFRSMISSYDLLKTSNIGIKGRHVYKLERKCREDKYTKLYPYGTAYGDEMFKDDTVVNYNLSFPFPLTESDKRNSIFIHVDGFLSQNTYSNVDYLWYFNDFLFSPFGTSLAIHNTSNAAIFYRETQSKDILQRASDDVNMFQGSKDFTAESALIVTYENLKINTLFNTLSNPSWLNTFQVVLIWNSTKTFTIFNYKELGPIPAFIGFKAPCDWDWAIEFLDNPTLIAEQTNVGIAGQFFYALVPEKCYKTFLYPHFYDYSWRITLQQYGRGYWYTYLSQSLEFFGDKGQDFYFTTDATIGMNRVSYIRESMYYNVATLAPYSLPYKFYNTFYLYGTCWGTTEKRDFLSIIDKDIHVTNPNFTSTYMLQFLWSNMPGIEREASYLSPERNTFQVTLVTDNTDTYVVYNYHKLQSVGAVVGFTDALDYLKPLTNSADTREVQYQSNIGIPGRFVFDMKAITNPIRDFPYGEEHGDQIHKITINSEDFEFKLKHIIPLSRIDIKSVYISVNGYLTANKKTTTLANRDMPIPNSETVFAIYRTLGGVVESGQIYYREITNASLLQTIHQSTENATNGIIVTFETGNKYYQNKFQLILLTDGVKSFVFYKYYKIDINLPHSRTFAVEARCKYYFIGEYLLQTSSNIDKKGEYLVQINDVNECIIPEFYPYNTDSSELVLSNDGGEATPQSGMVKLPQKMPLFSIDSDVIYIFSSGYISINQPADPQNSEIATLSIFVDLYWNDNAFLSGQVFYRPIVDQFILNEVSGEIREEKLVDFNGTFAYIVTYFNVRNYYQPLKYNTYQLVLITDSKDTYVIKNYASVYGTNGVIGYGEPDCNHHETYIKSFENIKKELRQSKHPGRIIEKLTDSVCSDKLKKELESLSTTTTATRTTTTKTTELSTTTLGPTSSPMFTTVMVTSGTTSGSQSIEQYSDFYVLFLSWSCFIFTVIR